MEGEVRGQAECVGSLSLIVDWKCGWFGDVCRWKDQSQQRSRMRKGWGLGAYTGSLLKQGQSRWGPYVGPSEVIQGPSWVNLVGATALGRDF